MPSLSRTALAALLLGALAVPLPPDLARASQEISAAEDGKRKINLSGRQRMLSQRMAKAVCFASLGVEADAHLRMAADAHALFDRTLKGLRAGDPELGMRVEQAPDILVELDAVDALWVEYGSAVAEATVSTPVSAEALAEVARLNGPTLVQMNKAVQAFERRYGATGDIHPALALALNVSGRQRMLSQKASKEFCLIAHGVDAEVNRAALADTVALFETSLRALMDGDEAMNLPEAPTDEIYAQLGVVEALWTPLKAIFDATAAGAAPTAEHRAQVAADNNPLLVEMNKAVWMYDDL